ncbi:MAG: biotin carboxylase N-terminal domain-containing protein [Pseudomonadota bacterium]|nr:biotin carboxylase N-terminal domain-containing protein [Pseudomonadota bacterium]
MLFNKVLIANRGEIAVRLIRACERLGLHSIAIFSDVDADAPYVELADEAVNIGPPEAAASYLDGERVIAAALRTGAAAIHPGYGFLAENAAFARRCINAGLVFVGPSPDLIASMGAKIEAKRIATDAGVACVPGYHAEEQSDETLLREAEKIGTPLLVKASAGGGGRGIRRVEDLKALPDALRMARNEAQTAFGDPSVLLERFIEAPRHIEVQILADKHGNVRHLYERDCSIQRNYQKIIEEAPAPNLKPELRARILADAVKLAAAIDYDNVGTVEFIVDAAEDQAYFLEMNTRLQVEHPVTEFITGIDLVEWQLRIAGDEKLSFEQADVACDGWAIEARVAAENPAASYRPETGTISSYVEPQSPDLRIDSGIRCGSKVTPYYDSMLAKVIAKGADRESAIRSLRHGLSRFRIAGVGVNIGFLQDVLQLAEFRSGRHLTNCLERAFPKGWESRPITNADLALAVLARHIRGEFDGCRSPWSALGAWRIGEKAGRSGAGFYYVQDAAETFGITKVLGRGGTYTVERDGETVIEVRQAAWKDGCLIYMSRDQKYLVDVSVDGARVCLHRAAGSSTFDVLSAEDVLLNNPSETAAGGNSILAPTPGLIAEVLVSPGQPVEAGQPVIVLEAMKLLQQLCAPLTGVMDTIRYQRGDTVDGGDCLATIEPAEAGDAAQVRADD